MNVMRRTVPVIFALAVVAVAAAAWWWGHPLIAQVKSEVGYVDWELVANAYAAPEIASIEQERDRLQEEFDREAASLEEPAVLELFAEYEARLDAFRQAVYASIQERLLEIEKAVADAAAEAGVSVVVDQNVVVWGGVDLTEAVLRRLGLIE